MERSCDRCRVALIDNNEIHIYVCASSCHWAIELHAFLNETNVLT